MNDQLNKEVIGISFQAVKLSERVLLTVLKAALNQSKKVAKKARIPSQNHGEMKLSKLVSQGQGATSVELSDQNYKLFKKVLKSYNVDYAIQKDTSCEPPKYMLFFKAKDTDVIKQAFRKYVALVEKDKKKPSLQMRLNQAKEQVKQQTQNRAVERNRNRELSL